MNGDDNKKEEVPALGSTGRDRVLAGVKGIAGLTPFAGSILSEIIGQLIPEQRWERLEAYVKRLTERLCMIEEETLAEKMRKPEKIDLFEEGAFQAARSLSPERTDYIANIVSMGISGEAKQEIEAKRLMKILAELEDDQIINLASRFTEVQN